MDWVVFMGIVAVIYMGDATQVYLVLGLVDFRKLGYLRIAISNGGITRLAYAVAMCGSASTRPTEGFRTVTREMEDLLESNSWSVKRASSIFLVNDNMKVSNSTGKRLGTNLEKFAGNQLTRLRMLLTPVKPLCQQRLHRLACQYD